MNFPIIKETLNGNSIIVIDGGARNGPKELFGLDDFCEYYCFEPNPNEIKDIENFSFKKNPNNQSKLNVFPYALSNKSGNINLYISARPGATSTLYPDENLLSRFKKDNWSEMHKIVEKVSVPSISLIFPDLLLKA